jgi:hypothetical protein
MVHVRLAGLESFDGKGWPFSIEQVRRRPRETVSPTGSFVNANKTPAGLEYSTSFGACKGHLQNQQGESEPREIVTKAT